MKRIQAVIFALLVVFPAVAHADKIIKKDKGIINGTIISVTINTSRGKQEYAREKLTSVALDQVVLAEGITKKGALQTVTIKTVAGSLILKADEILAVEKFDADQLKQEYEKKLGEINQKDGVAMLELAEWCQKNELNAEMVKLAGEAMKLGLPEARAGVAHHMLGHIKVGDTWIDDSDGGGDAFEMKAEAAPDKEVEIPNKPVDQATVDAYKKLAKEYKDKISASNESDKLSIRNTWEKKLEDAARNVKMVNDRIDQLEEARKRYKDNNDTPLGRMNNNNDYYDQIGDQIDAEKKRLSESKYERAKIIHQIKKAQEKYSRTSSRRNQGYRDAAAKIERMLGMDKALTEAEMREIFDGMIDKE